MMGVLVWFRHRRRRISNDVKDILWMVREGVPKYMKDWKFGTRQMEQQVVILGDSKD